MVLPPSLLASIVLCVCWTLVSCQSTSRDLEGHVQQEPGTDQLTALSKNHMSKRATIIKPNRNLWPAGRIPYILDSRFSEQKVSNIMEAMQSWENVTCIRFVQREPDDQNYVYFEERYTGLCQTYVGYNHTVREHIVFLGACALRPGNIMHEIGHVIGFYHEQNRPDRDKYIKVFVNNIDSKKRNNFLKFSKSKTRTIGYAYDYESIMHYSSTVFSNGDGPTFKIKKIASGFNFTVGQRRRISDLDAAQARWMYKCNKLPVDSTCVANNGIDYRGNLDYTVSGITCQRWSSNWPHRHTHFTEASIIDKGLGDHNYCRNPDGRARPWCFTTKKKPSWQYCDLKSCQVTGSQVDTYQDDLPRLL